ncbi:hypothetical protein M427DRAFT_382955 [Gonapodya prolifera JEL478]|uniref:Uncharacterized protein n=1 Tax=Gonapodya prolifera (strain JEL478) TaxID=1344416 RepID=A0A139A991_GONPJ|nr:hypothetical protein M427DRAFT_382955 [Gonapodya prolifera JEL478]|eukprot:KXS13336.1 hypothetical protein M427DRAFT_382955 [Gonapodya prolifera JEL478]
MCEMNQVHEGTAKLNRRRALQRFFNVAHPQTHPRSHLMTSPLSIAIGVLGLQGGHAEHAHLLLNVARSEVTLEYLQVVECQRARGRRGIY